MAQPQPPHRHGDGPQQGGGQQHGAGKSALRGPGNAQQGGRLQQPEQRPGDAVGHQRSPAVPARDACDHGQHQRSQAAHGERMHRAEAEHGGALRPAQQLRDTAQHQRQPEPAKTDMQHCQQAVLQAFDKAPFQRQPEQQSTRRKFNQAANQRPRCPACAGRYTAQFDPRGSDFKNRDRQHQPQQPERTPCVHPGQGAGREKRNHAVRDGQIHHQHKAPQSGEYAGQRHGVRL